MATNFEPHECVIFVQSTKIGNHENKAIHSSWKVLVLRILTLQNLFLLRLILLYMD